MEQLHRPRLVAKLIESRYIIGPGVWLFQVWTDLQGCHRVGNQVLFPSFFVFVEGRGGVSVSEWVSMSE